MPRDADMLADRRYATMLILPSYATLVRCRYFRYVFRHAMIRDDSRYAYAAAALMFSLRRHYDAGCFHTPAPFSPLRALLIRYFSMLRALLIRCRAASACGCFYYAMPLRYGLQQLQRAYAMICAQR